DSVLSANSTLSRFRRLFNSRSFVQCPVASTWLNYALDLKTFFAFIDQPLETIRRSECLKFIEHQDRQGYARATINRRLATLSSLFEELQLLDPVQFPRNPINPLRRQKLAGRHSQSLYRKQAQRIPDVIPDAALHTFFTVLPTWRDKTIVLLMWMSCLRVGEVVAIRFEDIECSHKTIQITNPKGGWPRTVYMNDLTFASLNRYLDEERRDLFPEEPALFVAFKGRAQGHPLSVNAIQKSIAYYSKRSGLPHLHPHQFRHTGITQLIQAGMPEPAVRKLVGHHHPASLLPYLHLADSYVEEEFHRAEPAFTTVGLLNLSDEMVETASPHISRNDKGGQGPGGNQEHGGN
nr:tyrosine-type recombinase/integrase [Anaerolineae bacterium]